MCRLFGFRSIIPSQVHSSLVSAENALVTQSEVHCDGWGVAYYVAGAPHVIKSVSSAVDDHIFKRISGVVSSETVIAHLRKATVGLQTILNTHPFQFGKWTFAHNGNIKNFKEHSTALRNSIDPNLSRFILGETDSEVLFFLILTHMSRYIDLNSDYVDIDAVARAVISAVDRVVRSVGNYHEHDDGDPSESYLSFMITNGNILLAFQAGKKLHYSTYKTRCSDRALCPSFSPVCEGPSTTGQINHFIVSSEPLQGENVWLPMTNGQLVGVDSRMQFRQWNN